MTPYVHTWAAGRDRKMRWARSLTIFLAAFAIVVPMYALADVEENDTLMEPETIGVGVMLGNVTYREVGTWPNITIERDDDCYIHAIPPMTRANFTLKKLDRSAASITVQFYDSEGFDVYTTGSLHVSVQGESSKTSYLNDGDEPFDIVMMVRGNGSYSLSVERSPYRDDTHDPWDDDMGWIDAPSIDDGVYTGSVSSTSGPAVKYYEVTVPEGYVLEIEVTKTDQGSGTIYVDTFTPFEEVGFYDVELEITGPGTNRTGRYENNGLYERTKVIRVYGNGDYRLSVDTSQRVDTLGEEFALILLGTMLIMLVAVLIPLMIPVVMVIIIVVIVLVVLNQSKKKKQLSSPPSPFGPVPTGAPAPSPPSSIPRYPRSGP